jgi:hypothetical protein
MRRTSATKLALLGGFGAVALLATLVRQDHGGATQLELAPAREPAAAGSASAPSHVVSAPAVGEPRMPLPSKVVDTRASEAEIVATAAEESYARLGGFFVDHLVARGLARPDGERVVRRFVDDSVDCLFDALRLEADAQAVDYESVLDAMEANLHATDGPLLAGLLDMAAVAQRVTPCSLAVAQQAGLDPSVFAEAARAAFRRAP